MTTAADPLAERLARGDGQLFAAVLSATSPADRRSLLALQAAVRADGDYAYLEIGTYLGGTLQPHLADPRCRRIYAIDKRTPTVADIRGTTYAYTNNTSAEMLAGLRAGFGDAVKKVVTFDCDASEVAVAAIVPVPRFGFIDGEHTVAAVRRDFAFCRRAVAPDGVIAFHDTNLIFDGIAACELELRREGVPHRVMKLAGTVTAILLGDAVPRHGPILEPLAENARWYRLKSRLALPWAGVVGWIQPRWLRLIWAAIGAKNRVKKWFR